MATRTQYVRTTPKELQIGDTLVVCRQALRIADIAPLTNRLHREIGVVVELEFGTAGSTLIQNFPFEEPVTILKTENE